MTNRQQQKCTKVQTYSYSTNKIFKGWDMKLKKLNNRN